MPEIKNTKRFNLWTPKRPNKTTKKRFSIFELKIAQKNKHKKRRVFHTLIEMGLGGLTFKWLKPIFWFDTSKDLPINSFGVKSVTCRAPIEELTENPVFNKQAIFCSPLKTNQEYSIQQTNSHQTHLPFWIKNKFLQIKQECNNKKLNFFKKKIVLFYGWEGDERQKWICGFWGCLWNFKEEKKWWRERIIKGQKKWKKGKRWIRWGQWLIFKLWGLSIINKFPFFS